MDISLRCGALSAKCTAGPNSLGLRNPKRVKNESKKSLPGQGSKKSEKSQKRVKNESKRVIFDSFLTIFGLFGPLGPEGPGDSFLTLLGFRAWRARNGSVAGGAFSSLGHFLSSWAWHWMLQKPPLLKAPFLGSWARIFFLYSRGREYRHGMYSHQNELPQALGKYAENNFSIIFSCIHTRSNAGPECLRAKWLPQELFPACIGFVSEGKNWQQKSTNTTI